MDLRPLGKVKATHTDKGCAIYDACHLLARATVSFSGALCISYRSLVILRGKPDGPSNPPQCLSSQAIRHTVASKMSTDRVHEQAKQYRPLHNVSLDSCRRTKGSWWLWQPRLWQPGLRWPCAFWRLRRLWGRLPCRRFWWFPRSVPSGLRPACLRRLWGWVWPGPIRCRRRWWRLWSW